MLTARVGETSVPAMTAKASTRDWKPAALAVSLAYALVFQALLLPIGGALQAGRFDVPRGILCAAGTQAAPDGMPVGDHDVLCCIVNCQGPDAAGGVPPPIVLRDRTGADGTVGPWQHPPRIHPPQVLPVGARAPPSFV